MKYAPLQLNPAALQEKEIREAFAILQVNGYSVEELQKKRLLKNTEKFNLKVSCSKSLSGMSIKSCPVVRNAGGRFEGGTKFGGYFFIKKGVMKDRQNWQCLNCKKKTVIPLEH